MPQSPEQTLENFLNTLPQSEALEWLTKNGKKITEITPTSRQTALHTGDLVIILSVPPTLLSRLPEDDQIAIQAIVGKPVTFAGMSYGQVKIEFRDSNGDEHTIWIDSDKIKPA
jgi:hypothetical protein